MNPMHKSNLTSLRPTAAALLASWILVALNAAASARQPRVNYVYPAGGQVGTSVEVTVGGQYFENVSGVRLSGDGVTGTILKDKELPNQPKEYRYIHPLAG